jgi:ABC-type dipeptide/oligopeptide/nickel transport system permease component
MTLGSYLFRRVVSIVPVILGVTFLTFMISHVVVKYPIRLWAGAKASPQLIAAIAAQYHLNDPIYLQYLYYMSSLLRGDWGVSPVSGVPVLQQIANFFPATIELTIVALIISIAIGIPVGVLSALWNGKKRDYPIRVFYLTGIASPAFLLAMLFQLVFSTYFRLLPSAGRLTAGMTPPTHITGMYIMDSLLTGNLPLLRDSLAHIILPATALALLTFAIITRMTRSSMLETITKDFVRTGRAKGLPRTMVTYRYVLRNALTSTITVIGFAVQFLLGGTIVIESIFFWPGIGLYMTRSILALDFPSIMGVTVLLTFVVVLTNLITDLAYGALDPRVRYE